jgi:hypothetical protein
MGSLPPPGSKFSMDFVQQSLLTRGTDVLLWMLSAGKPGDTAMS